MAFSLLAMLLTGCVIPPSLEVDQQDAALNSPPVITAVRTNTDQIREPGPLKVVRGASAGSLSVEVVDTDIDDALFVRLYVDYTIEAPVNFRSACPIPAGTATRSCSAVLDPVCFDEDVAAEPDRLPLLTVKVFDRPLEDVGEPAYQAMTDAAGLSSGLTFRLDCDDPIE